jgi:integrase
MLSPMPRPRPPYLHKQITRHGQIVWYVRRDAGLRTRLRAPYGTAEFWGEYQAALARKPATGCAKAGRDSLEWTVNLYQQSNAWLALGKETRLQRSFLFRKVIASAGDVPLADITRAEIVKARDRRTPASGMHFLTAMRGLFKWAMAYGIVTADPTQGVAIEKTRSDGFPVWQAADIAAFQARWPVGTRERLAFDLLLYTGLRRGDALVVGRQHVKDGIIRIATEKTGERVAIVIEPDLAETLATGPIGDLAFIVRDDGHAMSKNYFSQWFAAACRAAGVRKGPHGLRKAAATRDAERGFTESELEAKYGWRGGAMASRYTRAMNRERLSIQAAKRGK